MIYNMRIYSIDHTDVRSFLLTCNDADGHTIIIVVHIYRTGVKQTDNIYRYSVYRVVMSPYAYVHLLL